MHLENLEDKAAILFHLLVMEAKVFPIKDPCQMDILKHTKIAFSEHDTDKP